MGRLSKPSKIKELSGNPGKRKISKSEPRPFGTPQAPAGMSKPAQAVWQRLTVAMPAGVFTGADVFLLSAYCEAVAAHQTATRMIARQTNEVKGSTGQAKPNPWFSEQRAAATQIAQLGAKLGLDPVSRQQINTDSTETDTEGFGDLIN